MSRAARDRSEEERDEIARHAARLLRDGAAKDIPSAVRTAMIARGRSGAELERGTRRISAAMVREHARGLALEALGATGYDRLVASILGRAEETMTLLATQLGGRAGEARCVLVGRAARGEVDADPVVRIRVETDAAPGEIAAVLVAAGMDEPQFSSVETRYGRLDRLEVDDEGLCTRITRLPPSMGIPLDADLRAERGADKSVPALSLAAIRHALGTDADEHSPNDLRD